MTEYYIPQEIIRRKRDGLVLAPREIALLVNGLTDGSLADEQVGALAMAIFLNGMSTEETVALTMAMRDSGQILRWSGLDGPVVDKHSTGGIGDKLSLLIAPILAECGAFVPMISGRGLGHTGGTLDKLDSIPGYDTRPSLDRLQRIVREIGCAIVGQTSELAPADRRLYAIRDVTATVESIPLITASILSKKLAEGLDVLVMDVKFGSGAFLPEPDRAEFLAQTIVNVADGAGICCRALLTNMSRCLGRTAGNALEVLEVVSVLRSESRQRDLIDISTELCGEALAAANLASSPEAGKKRALEVLQSGRAAERFGTMVSSLGGPVDFIENAETYLPRAPFQHAVMPDRPGYVAAIDARILGLAVLSLGGGRMASDQAIDPRVGLSAVKAPGEYVDANEPLAIVHASADANAGHAAAQIQAAFEMTEAAPEIEPYIRRKLTPTAMANGPIA